MEQILGFAPDAPWGTLNALRDCSAMVPCKTGMEQASAFASTGWNALPATVIGSFVGVNTLGAPAYFAGTGTKLYRLSGSSWTDITRSVGGDYVAGLPWSFVQFGDQTLAANGGAYTVDPIQIATTTSGNFANISTAISATILISATSSSGGFVMAFNTKDASYGTSGDRWWCSAINDATSWAPSVATQATTGRLVGAPGFILAAANVSGDVVVAFKARAMYVGRYVGPPAVWQWTEIVGYGAAGKFAVCSANEVVFFANRDGLFKFDGVNVTSISDGKVTEWWKNNVSKTATDMSGIILSYDQEERQLRIWHPTTGSTLVGCLVYHVDSGNFGKDSINTVTSVASDPIQQNRFYVFYTDNIPYTTSYSQLRTAGSMTSGMIGDDEIVSTIDKFIVRNEKKHRTANGNASCIGYTYTESGGTATALTSVDATSDSPMGSTEIFKLRASGRWFNAKISYPNGSGLLNDFAKPIGIEAQITARGKR